MDWMLFAEEATAAHFVWNGKSLFLVLGEDDNYLLDPDMTQVSKVQATFNEAMTTPRKKTFTINKLRYNIVAKGLFNKL